MVFLPGNDDSSVTSLDTDDLLSETSSMSSISDLAPPSKVKIVKTISSLKKSSKHIKSHKNQVKPRHMK